MENLIYVIIRVRIKCTSHKLKTRFRGAFDAVISSFLEDSIILLTVHLYVRHDYRSFIESYA